MEGRTGGEAARRQGGMEKGKGGRKGGAQAKPGNQLVLYKKVYVLYSAVPNPLDRS